MRTVELMAATIAALMATIPGEHGLPLRLSIISENSCRIARRVLDMVLAIRMERIRSFNLKAKK